MFAISIHAIPLESGFKSSHYLVRTEMGTKWVIVEESKEESSEGSRDNKERLRSSEPPNLMTPSYSLIFSSSSLDFYLLASIVLAGGLQVGA